MIPADYDDFCSVVVGFAELKGKTLSPAAIELYWRAMQSWSLSDFKAAAEHLLRTCQFMPTPKDFEDLRKAGRPTAGEAWAKARENAKRAIVCGQVTSGPSCGDPVIDAAARAIGGYGEIAMCESGKLGFLERRFCEHYESIQDAGETRAALPHVVDDAPRSLAGPAGVKDLLPRRTNGSGGTA